VAVSRVSVDVATVKAPARDRVAELEAQLHKIVRRGQLLAQRRPGSMRDEAIAEVRAEYIKVHAKWRAARDQTSLF
jgi:hypothetical protein